MDLLEDLAVVAVLAEAEADPSVEVEPVEAGSEKKITE